ncbi:DNA replication ATP-dependent helicase/nuclease DNA2 [Sarcoptes scabiei]|uniref:DNA replication ATP-dependent helicase/nuclease n=2 Tax=Sarcoptes scabiei TaxID=52283 RepID=A0A834R0U7_SARSC|nr:DNA replication ATP-dependent helicase/nuclease DNA2 [Sarcoptes scabiei]
MMKKRLPTRFLVTSVNETESELCLKLKSTITIDQEDNEVYRCCLRQFWKKCRIESNDFVNIIDPRIEKDSETNESFQMIIDNQSGYLILRPDVLLSTTTLMSASYCKRKAWLTKMFEIYGEPNKSLLLGTIIHEIFQETIKRKQFKIEEIEKMFHDEVLKKFALEFYALNENLDELILEIRSYFKSISDWIRNYTERNSLNNPLFYINRLDDIENAIWSTKFGFIGKIDLSIEAMFEDKNNGTKVFNLIPLELKTGRKTFSVQHMGQVILYSFIMADKYINHKPTCGFLLYLKDEAKTERINSDKNVFRDLILLRNEFIKFYDKVGFIEDENRVDLLFRGPQALNTEYICKRCEHSLDCSLIHRCFDSAKSSDCDEKHYSDILLNHLDSKEIEFFKKMIMLLEIERQYALASDEFIFFWNFRSEQCEMSGIGLSKMKIKYQTKSSIVFQRSPRSALSTKFFTLNPDLKINSLDLIGRRIVISEEMINSTKTFSLYQSFCKKLCVIVGQISSFDDNLEEITIELDKDQINPLNVGTIYRIDILKTVSTRAMLINYSNLLRLMYADDPKAAELREIVINGRIPKFNINDCKVASFSKILQSPMLNDLNYQQKSCILGVLKTKCSLIFGSPGSGKTQTIVALIRILHQLGLSVLVTSFTHAAVDNIFLKLCEMDPNHQIEFVRTGSVQRIHPKLLKYSDHHLTQKWIEKCDLISMQKFYSTIPIVASTCLGVFNHPIFLKRQFDFCIIDEASQVFLSTSLGPLFNSQNFVLVGDQKQLPPVVQSPYARKLGLSDSLFNRLLTIAGKQDVCKLENSYSTLENINERKQDVDLKSIRIFPLFIQYRMNSIIMEVANKITYSGQLKCANKIIETISMLDRLEIEHQSRLNQFEKNYLHKIVSPNLEDSVVFIDTSEIEEANEINSNDSLSQSSIGSSSQNSQQSLPEDSQTGYVYNEFEVQLVIKIIQSFLQIYRKDFSSKNIGIISPFRRQVKRLLESFRLNSEFSANVLNDLEINTVDQYQGRDKDVIIYSCVKSFHRASRFDSQDSETSTPIVFDSELLKDERRLNVAITRAKRKLIIIGNRTTLKRYRPFRNLFQILNDKQLINLIDFDFRDIIECLR